MEFLCQFLTYTNFGFFCFGSLISSLIFKVYVKVRQRKFSKTYINLDEVINKWKETNESIINPKCALCSKEVKVILEELQRTNKAKDKMIDFFLKPNYTYNDVVLYIKEITEKRQEKI